MYFTSSHTPQTTSEAYLLPSLSSFVSEDNESIKHTVSNNTTYIWQKCLLNPPTP